MKIRINALTPGLDYAVSELRLLLGQYTSALFTDGDADFQITLAENKAMQPHWYALSGDGKTLSVTGGSFSSVLCGAYEALADAGVLFEATGHTVPKKFDLNAFMAANKEVHPKVRLRGVRQHINFPMDISSYPLKDAQEYIRALARMRFNAITFHSYPGQWHPVDPASPDDHPGHFFYGQTHPLPGSDPLTAGRIDNRKVYCIPEAEAIYDNEKARGEYAKYWLNEVMKTAKEAGLTITLSVEPAFEDGEKLGRMLRNVIEMYPLIDVLEIISYESGESTFLSDLTPETAPAVFRELLGSDALNADGTLDGLTGEIPHQLPGAAVSLRRMMTALNTRDQWLSGLEKKPELRVGMYITCKDTLKIILPVMRRLLPDDVTRSILPAHGAMVVANNIEELNLTEKDWQNTMLYSWAEFDGNMYLQQMSTDGLEKLTAMPEAESIYGLCINHWRTSENAMAINFAAETTNQPAKAADFYRNFADRVGISDADAFAAACDRLAKLDSYTRWNLMNFGFCFVGCWYKPGEVTPPRPYKDECMQHALAEYRALAEAFEALLDSASTGRGISYLRLMANRCRTSVSHVLSLLTLKGVHKYYDYANPSAPTEEQLAGIRQVISESLAHAQDYINLYGALMPDRGCQGNLISYVETTPVFIRIVASHFFGSGAADQTLSFDAPSSPDTEVDA